MPILLLPEFDTEIVIDIEKLEALSHFLKKKPSLYSSCFLISDSHVYPLYGSIIHSLLAPLHIPIHHYIIPAGEKSKTLETAKHCWEEMHQTGLDRKSLVIGLGGGSVTDMAGYVASCYMRGLDLVLIPTTLLGMVDAAIGGKTGVNLTTGKNIVGTIYHPKFVMISPFFLHTLPEREIKAGVAEIIKYGIIKSDQLFDYLHLHMDAVLRKEKKHLYHIVSESCQIKVKIVKQDEKDQGLRAILNFGHTFGHAIETLTEYRKYLHGEAVAMGMCLAAHVSEALTFTSHQTVEQIVSLCEKAKLPTNLPPELSIDDLLKLMEKDKKTISKKINLILVEKVGKVFQITDVDKKLIKETLKEKTGIT